MVGEEKWYIVSSYENAIILIRNYETNTVTWFFSWETRSSRPHLFRRIAVPKIMKNFQKKKKKKNTGDEVRFK